MELLIAVTVSDNIKSILKETLYQNRNRTTVTFNKTPHITNYSQRQSQKVSLPHSLSHVVFKTFKPKEHTEFGDKPLNAFSSNSNLTREFKFPIAGGILPSNKLLLISKTSSFFKSPSSVGSGPLMEFFLNLKILRFSRFPILLGIVPEKPTEKSSNKLSSSWISSNFQRSPIKYGSSPSITLTLKCKSLIFSISLN